MHPQYRFLCLICRYTHLWRMRYKSRPIVIPYALFLIKCIILTDQWSTGLNKHNQQSYNSTQHRQATGNTDYPAHLIVYVNLLMCKRFGLRFSWSTIDLVWCQQESIIGTSSYKQFDESIGDDWHFLRFLTNWPFVCDKTKTIKRNS